MKKFSGISIVFTALLVLSSTANAACKNYDDFNGRYLSTLLNMSISSAEPEEGCSFSSNIDSAGKVHLILKHGSARAEATTAGSQRLPYCSLDGQNEFSTFSSTVGGKAVAIESSNIEIALTIDSVKCKFQKSDALLP